MLKKYAGGGVVGTTSPSNGRRRRDECNRALISEAGSNPAPSLQSFFVPGPLPGVNEHAGRNVYTYRTMKKRWGATISQVIRVARLQPMHRVQVTFVWVEKNRRRNKDNIRFAAKFILDALVACGILPNDGWDEIEGFRDTFLVDASNPGVTVTMSNPTDLPEVCRSHRPGEDWCRDGFPQSVACRGFNVVPFCLLDDLCARLFANTGGKPVRGGDAGPHGVKVQP